MFFLIGWCVIVVDDNIFGLVLFVFGGGEGVLAE